MIVNIKILDMGMIGVLFILGFVIYLYNCFFDIELLEWFGIFSGFIFVFMFGFFVMILVVIIVVFMWLKV